MEALLQGFDLAFNATTLTVIFFACLYGLIVGAIPGLTATMATALLIPATFSLDPVSAIAAIVATAATAIFAGDIPGALLRIPGTPASAAYTQDAYALTKTGKPHIALGTGLIASVIGGVIGVMILLLIAPQLARFAAQFSSVEYFWLAALGLSCTVVVSGNSRTKGALSLLIGLFISTIGIDIATGYARFTGGNINLLSGVSFIPAMIGLFAVSQLLKSVNGAGVAVALRPVHSRGLWGAMVTLAKRFKVTILRSSLLGNLLGALPGAGADIAAWVAYAISKSFSKTAGRYGCGSEEGIAGASAANNSAVGGAWTPALVFGIPGDSITAIAVGVMFMKGITPSPQVFVTDGPEVYAILICFLIANLFMLPLGYLAIRIAHRVVSIPSAIMMPAVLVFAAVGAFAVDRTMFAIGIIAVLGVLGYLMEKNDIPLAPAILSIVLGKILEKNFLITMIKTEGQFLQFFDRPIAAVLGIVCIAVWGFIIGHTLRQTFRRNRPK